jgi:hypothetical protein
MVAEFVRIRSLPRTSEFSRIRLRKSFTALRAGAATLDYVLVLAVVLPLIALVLRVAPRIMNLVYEMTSVLVSWPFM